MSVVVIIVIIINSKVPKTWKFVKITLLQQMEKSGC